MVEKTKWGNIRIRQELINRLSKILEIKAAKTDGFTNVSQFADHILRKTLEDMEKQMEHVNMYVDHVKIMDRKLGKLGRIVSVYFKKGGSSWCDYCDANDCIHIQYAWELSDVRKILEKEGLKPPASRPKS